MSDKVTLAAQILEVDREIAMRRKVYPGWVSRGKMRQAESDLHIRQMEAVRETLEWLKANEDRIREALKSEAA